MSRLFDALQRSGLEQTGIEYPDMVSVATKVFEAGENLREAEQPEGTPKTTALPEEFSSVPLFVEANSRMVFLTQPESLAAEKFRFLGARMRQLQQSRSMKRLLVTSTIPEEGKSLVSANLAGVLARRRRQKVLLLEGDLRRPVLAEKFGLGKLDGLGEWLRGDAESLTNIYRLERAEFWLMPAGRPAMNPMELLQSARMRDLLGLVSSLFDWVIVDSPPLLPLGDTTVWQRMTDGILLVVREGVTEKRTLEQGLETLKQADLLGIVLNGSSNGNHRNYYQRYATLPQQS